MFIIEGDCYMRQMIPNLIWIVLDYLHFWINPSYTVQETLK